MKKFQYSETELKFIEKTSVPMAVYQFVDKRVVTLALSQGFCRLFGFDDRAEAYFIMDNDMYRDAHPDDVVRISEAAYTFATRGGDYDVVYRNKSSRDTSYRIIHALGAHEYTETGERIAVIWYSDEGEYTDDKGAYSSMLNRLYNEALNRESITRENSYDFLTGLPNMSYFFQLSEAGRDRLLADERQPAMVYFDLSGMKGFNSRYGYAEGDKLLKAFASLLVRHFSKENCGRIGGDHFVVYADDHGLKEKLEKIFEECQDINGGRSLPVRAGIFLKIIGKNLDAGIACDRAKAAADSIRDIYGSGYRYFDKEMLAEYDHRQYIIENLDKAIEEQWIKVYYQPIIRAANGRVCDEEALSRWIDPVKGYLSPDRFIPILEQSHLTYKLDLYVVDSIIEKIKKSMDEGLYIVPQSVNLSRYDFESCDIVEEIRKRVDAAGVSRDKLTIEITESVIGSDFEFMKKQVERLHGLGFNVWMDDFGSDYSSLDFLQSIPFDLIKLDMRFMKQLDESEKTRVIVTELVRLAMNLGIDTVCEGVETEEQVEFLREIGCTKMQGFFYCKPIPPEEIINRYRTGIQIGFENPEEASYYEAIGRINLYDISGMRREENDTLGQYFDTIPMTILETDDEKDDGSYSVLRRNKTFREFVTNSGVKPSRSFVNAVRSCARSGESVVIDEMLDDGSSLHIYLTRIARNPVRKTSAVAVAILATGDSDERTAGVSYAAVAKALSADYVNLFYVNTENENFIEYSTDPEFGELSLERHGKDFFSESRRDALNVLYPPDQSNFINVFTKENVMNSLRRKGFFTLTYRQMYNNEPVYVSMKASRLAGDPSHIVIGVNNVDAEMKHKAELEKIREERKTYARITALTGDFLSFYTVDPDNGHYVEYSVADAYDELGFSQTGTDFFGESRAAAAESIYSKDLDMFMAAFTKENILKAIEKDGVFSIQYRLLMNGEPRYVRLRAAMTGNNGDRQIVVGVNDVDSAVKRELEFSKGTIKSS